MTPIPQFPQYPSRADSPEEFMLEADAFLAHFPTFQGAANTLSSEMDTVAANTALMEAYATDAADAAIFAATAATGVANYKGVWSSLAGPLAIPASVAHDSRIWTLTQSVANVALETPGVSDKWVTPYPVRRINLFSDVTANLRAMSSGEPAFSSYVKLSLVSAARLAVCGTGGFAVSSSVASSTIMTSLDNGVTWVSKAMPQSAVWRVMGFGSRLYAVADGATGAGAIAYSDDNGATWTPASYSGTWSSSTVMRAAADTSGTFGAALTSTAGVLAVTNDSGSTWTNCVTAPQLESGSTAFFVIGNTLIGKSASSTYYTSNSAQVGAGTWTTRALPGNATDLVRTEGGTGLLAYTVASLTEPIYLLTNTTTFEWVSLGRPLWTVASVRLITPNVLLTSSSAGPLDCATARIQGADQRWVPRYAHFAITATPYTVVRNASTALVLANQGVYRISLADGAEPLGLWE